MVCAFGLLFARWRLGDLGGRDGLLEGEAPDENLALSLSMPAATTSVDVVILPEGVAVDLAVPRHLMSNVLRVKT